MQPLMVDEHAPLLDHGESENRVRTGSKVLIGLLLGLAIVGLIGGAMYMNPEDNSKEIASVVDDMANDEVKVVEDQIIGGIGGAGTPPPANGCFVDCAVNFIYISDTNRGCIPCPNGGTRAVNQCVCTPPATTTPPVQTTFNPPPQTTNFIPPPPPQTSSIPPPPPLQTTMFNPPPQTTNFIPPPPPQTSSIPPPPQTTMFNPPPPPQTTMFVPRPPPQTTAVQPPPRRPRGSRSSSSSS